jgi:hypothetical protein
MTGIITSRLSSIVPKSRSMKCTLGRQFLIATLAVTTFLAALPTTTFASENSNDRVTRILAGLLGDDRSTLLGSVPEVEFTPSLKPFAAAEAPGRIVFSRGLLDQARSDGEIAFILSHELAHLKLRHRDTPALTGKNLAAIVQQELEADTIAIKLMERSGFDPAVGIGLLKRLDVRDGRGRSLYPSISIRLEALRRECPDH